MIGTAAIKGASKSLDKVSKQLEGLVGGGKELLRNFLQMKTIMHKTRAVFHGHESSLEALERVSGTVIFLDLTN